MQRSFQHELATDSPHRLAKVVSMTLALVTLAFGGSTLMAQSNRPVRHEFIRGDMPPGLAASYYRMNNRSLENHEQPVQVVAPRGTLVEVPAQGGFVQSNDYKVNVGLMIGPVYRFKLTNIPEHPGKELYPSVEVINRLHPPKDLVTEFPIQVVLNPEDLSQALDGRMVTKVIYLEDARTALPHQHREESQPYFDVGGAEDPLRAAEQMGRPMAIVRIGSRVPLQGEQGQFNFGAPSPRILPNPAGAGAAASKQPTPPMSQRGMPAADATTQPALQPRRPDQLVEPAISNN